jgi:hypothetical protein
MQILVLDRCPRKAVRKFRSKKLPGKLLVEALQLMGQALRHYGRTDPELYKSPNSSHPCAIWVRSGKDAFTWTLKHARECYNVFDLYVRKRCKTCRGYTGNTHGSLKALEFIERLVETNQLPDAMPDNVNASQFYAQFDAVRSRQSPAARNKSGAVVRVSTGLPCDCSCMAVAIDGEHQKTCMRYDNAGGVDGVQTYIAYHVARFPVVDEPDWACCDDARVPTHACACEKASRKRPATVLVKLACESID